MPAIDHSCCAATMDLASCTDTLRAKVGDASGLGAVLKFDCGADGVVVIDGRAVPNTVDNLDRDADCTIAITLANLAALVGGELDPVTGFMSGRFKVAGDMSVAMKLQRLI
jgi:putative sterol carrier protein